MTSEFVGYINLCQNILDIHGRLKQHVIIYPPPYSIAHILGPIFVDNGKRVSIVINHRTRDVNVSEPSISRHVLQTAVRTFQSHRLQALQVPFFPVRNRSSPDIATKKDCPICFETLTTNNAVALACAHSFHPQCIRPWVMENNSCPVCRHPV